MRGRLLSLVFLAALVTCSRTVEAATIGAHSCSRADVGNAVAGAGNGDTVTIPAGDCTWTSQLNVNVGIVLAGSGQGVTIFRDNVPKDGSNASSLMGFTVNAPNTFRITGFTLVGMAPESGKFFKGHIMIGGTSKAFRVDHITTIAVPSTFVRARGDLWGVIDHITHDSSTPLLMATHDSWGGKSFGDGSWADALSLGTEKAIYIEDCTLTTGGAAYGYIHDGDGGARTVIRYNRLTRGSVGAHGTDSGQRTRSIRSMEIYNNTFTWLAGDAPDFVAWFRGGTGVMFNNTVIAPSGVPNHVAKHLNLRDSTSYTPWGKCDGSSVYDQNTAGESGYRCVDQPGSGTSNLISGNPASPASWVRNINDPIYVWGNIVNGSPNNCGRVGCGNAGHVYVDRDIKFGTARPGYTPYPYPHPLAGNPGTVSSPPTAVQVK